MIGFIKNTIYKVLSYFDFGGVVVLMYHSVGDNLEFFTVATGEFEKQMAYLARNNFKVIGLGEFERIMTGEIPMPRGAVLITFDDGYEDNYTNAYPILKKYNLPATIFVSTALIGKEVSARSGSRLKLVSELQMKEMAAGGLVDFGSHCNNHRKLTGRDGAEVEAELADSGSLLKNILSKEPVAIAYPWGACDNLSKLAAGRHYSLAFTVAKGRVGLKDDKLALRRNSIDSGVSMVQFSGIAKYGRV